MESGYSDCETLEALERLIATRSALAVWFSGGPECGVCRVLQPKIAALMRDRFPRIGLYRVDGTVHPDIAAAHRVFAVPTLLVFFDGREWIRHSRNLSLGRLQAEIERPYRLAFT